MSEIQKFQALRAEALEVIAKSSNISARIDRTIAELACAELKHGDDGHLRLRRRSGPTAAERSR